MTHKGLRWKQLLQFFFFLILVILKDCYFPEKIPENLRHARVVNHWEHFQLEILHWIAAIAENHLNMSQPRWPPQEKILYLTECHTLVACLHALTMSCVHLHSFNPPVNYGKCSVF